MRPWKVSLQQEGFFAMAIGWRAKTKILKVMSGLFSSQMSAMGFFVIVQIDTSQRRKPLRCHVPSWSAAMFLSLACQIHWVGRVSSRVTRSALSLLLM